LEETRKRRKESLGETKSIVGRNKKMQEGIARRDSTHRWRKQEKKCRKESLGETQSIVGRNKKKKTQEGIIYE
jgi:hypothetical protein